MSICSASSYAPFSRNSAKRTPRKRKSNCFVSGLRKPNLPEEAKKEFERELGTLERLPARRARFPCDARLYLEFVLDLPWNSADGRQSGHRARAQVLDEDHFGLKEVKERILEHLSVLKRNPEGEGSDLCLVGPPGVGKTSLGQSIAERWDASSNASASAECMTRPNCAVTGGPISAPWLDACCRRCAARALTIRC